MLIVARGDFDRSGGPAMTWLPCWVNYWVSYLKLQAVGKVFDLFGKLRARRNGVQS